MGDDTRIPPKSTDSVPPTERRIIMEKEKAGKMEGEREVTWLSIIKDIGNQGFIKTIQSLFNHIFSKEENDNGASEFVITVRSKLPAGGRASQIAEKTFPAPILAPIAETKQKLDPNKSTYQHIIDEMENKQVITRSQAENLMGAFASKGHQQLPIQEIKNALDAQVEKINPIQLPSWKDVRAKMDVYWQQRLAPPPNLPPPPQISETPAPSSQISKTPVTRISRFPKTPPPPPPPISRQE